jgi:hypothetical protein
MKRPRLSLRSKINLNRGILNPERLAPELGAEIAALRGKCPLRDRMDAANAHEHHERSGLSRPETSFKHRTRRC